jgi:hypothetical protein
MSKAEVLARAEHARAYLLVADLVRGDASITARSNILGAIAVLAGIAASDAICGKTLGKSSSPTSFAPKPSSCCVARPRHSPRRRPRSGGCWHPKPTRSTAPNS